MRNKIVKVGDKEILVVEKRIKELKQLSKDLSLSFNDFIKTDLDNKTTDDVFNIIFETIEDKITVVFPQLSQDDIENAYISEIEELIEVFIDVNFTGAKKVFSPLMMSVLRN